MDQLGQLLPWVYFVCDSKKLYSLQTAACALEHISALDFKLSKFNFRITDVKVNA